MPFCRVWLLISSPSNLSVGGRSTLLWGGGNGRTSPPLKPSRNENHCLVGGEVTITLKTERADPLGNVVEMIIASRERLGLRRSQTHRTLRPRPSLQSHYHASTEPS